MAMLSMRAMWEFSSASRLADMAQHSIADSSIPPQSIHGGARMQMLDQALFDHTTRHQQGEFKLVIIVFSVYCFLVIIIRPQKLRWYN